jgi:hypothetical protein
MCTCTRCRDADVTCSATTLRRAGMSGSALGRPTHAWGNQYGKLGLVHRTSPAGGGVLAGAGQRRHRHWLLAAARLELPPLPPRRFAGRESRQTPHLEARARLVGPVMPRPSQKQQSFAVIRVGDQLLRVLVFRRGWATTRSVRLPRDRRACLACLLSLLRLSYRAGTAIVHRHFRKAAGTIVVRGGGCRAFQQPRLLV